MARSCAVAVIGAGVSGIAAARELLREGHRVVVFEKADRIGGTWVYDPRTDSDPSGLDQARQVVQSSLYRSLRTNLPRPLMGFSDYPFPEASACFVDGRVFPAHAEVLAFIEAFAEDFSMSDVVRLGAEVVRVARVGERKDEWVVEWRRVEEAPAISTETEMFQAVVICNGHHTQPQLADVPGLEKWPGKQIHSHNYRVPEPFQDQVVVIIGMGASAHDISREISKLAKEVHMASRSTHSETGKLNSQDNIWQHKMIKFAYQDGTVVFDDGFAIIADVVLHCTGYAYNFPFLEANEIVTIDDKRVGPLYKHVFPPHLAPWISFVGIPNKTIIFLMIELQCKWLAKVLSRKLTLPIEEDMIASVKKYYISMEELRRPKRYTHYFNPDEHDYLDWLAAEVGLKAVEEWRWNMYSSVMKCIMCHDDGYRDRWDLDHWIQQSKPAKVREVLVDTDLQKKSLSSSNEW